MSKDQFVRDETDFGSNSTKSGFGSLRLFYWDRTFHLTPSSADIKVVKHSNSTHLVNS